MTTAALVTVLSAIALFAIRQALQNSAWIAEALVRRALRIFLKRRGKQSVPNGSRNWTSFAAAAASS